MLILIMYIDAIVIETVIYRQMAPSMNDAYRYPFNDSTNVSQVFILPIFNFNELNLNFNYFI